MVKVKATNIKVIYHLATAKTMGYCGGTTRVCSWRGVDVEIGQLRSFERFLEPIAYSLFH